MIAAKPIRTTAKTCHAVGQQSGCFGGAKDVDDHEVAQKSHRDRYHEAGQLADDDADHIGGGSCINRRCAVDGKHALEGFPGPIVAGIESAPGNTICGVRLSVGDACEGADQQKGERKEA